MNANEMQEKLDSFDYWDAEVLEITSRYFGDELFIHLKNEDGRNIGYTFLGCDRVEMQHCWGYAKLKPLKEYTKLQLDYFAHQITIKVVEQSGKTYYECSWDLFPMNLIVYCTDIEVEVFDNKS